MATRSHLYAVLGCAFSVVLGAGIAQTFWEVTGDAALGTSYDGAAPLWGPMLLLPGLAGPALLHLGADWERRRLGHLRASGRAGFLGTAAVTVGAAAAVLVWWDAPAVVGEGWSFWGWFAYTARWWLPALLAAATVATAVAWRYGVRRARADVVLRDRLLATGARTTGVVSHVRVLHAHNDQGQRTVVGAIGTVRFTDQDGTERRVERRVGRTTRLVTGAPAEVLHDPLAPGQDDAVLVAFARHPGPTDWVPAS